MAARLNTKFLLLAIVTTVVAVGLVAGLFALRATTDATKNIAEGDALMAEGQYARALTAYGRAAAKEQSNLEYLAKVESALVRIRPETAVEANERFALYQSILERRTGISPRDGQMYGPYLELLHTTAELYIGNLNHWQALQQLADRMSRQFDPGSPYYIQARLYRGVAALGRQRALTEDERNAALDDLRAVIDAEPDNDLAWATLVRARFAIVDQYRGAGRPASVIADARSEADRALADAVAAAPNGARVATAELTVLLDRRGRGVDTVTIDRIDSVASRLALNATEVDDPIAIRNAVQALSRVRDPRSSRRAGQIADAYRARHPDSLFAQALSMDAASAERDLDAMAASAKAILDSPLPPVGLESIFRPIARAGAAERLFDTAFERLRLAPESERRVAATAAREALEVMRRERSVLLGESDRDPTLLKAEGRIDLFNERYAEALTVLERAIRLVGDSSDDDLRFLAAQAALRQGDFGLAATRIDEAIRIRPNNPYYVAVRAQIKRAIGDIDGAIADIEAALAAAPGDEFVQFAAETIRSRDDAVELAVRESNRRALAGDYDGARAAIEELVSQRPTDARLIRQQARIAVAAGDHERAVEIARIGLEHAPDSPDLLQIIAIAESDDFIDAAVRTSEIMIADERLRPMSIHNLIAQEAIRARMRASDRRLRGDADGAEAQLAEADRLEAALPTYRAKASELDPPDPRYVQLIFDEALVANRLDDARGLIRRERGRAEPLFTAPQLVRWECRALLAEAQRTGPDEAARRRDLMVEAITLASSALDRNPESTDLHVLLGELHGFLGNLRESIQSYERAYAQRPTDLRIIQLYATALQRAGERARLLSVLRAANRVTNMPYALHDTWLDVEALYGSPRVALSSRRDRLRSTPTDTVNALKLINLLVTLVPARDLAVDAQGRERFTESQWRGMSTAEQRQAMETLRRQWLDEATRTLDGIAVTPDNRMQIAGVRAELLRRRGDVAGGERVLRDAIAAAGDRADAGMWLSLANYLVSVGKSSEADVAFDEALRRQGPSLEADRVLTDTRAAQGRYAEAIEHLKKIVAATPDRIAHLRLVELLQRIDRLDEADAELTRAVARHGTDVESLQLRSVLLARRSAMASGEEARRLRQQQFATLDQAIELAPADPTPLVSKAEALYDVWLRGGAVDPEDPQVLEAIRLADRAIGLQANHWPATRLKAQILTKRGDLGRARAELDRLLEISPGSDDARAFLIELWMLSRNNERAIQVAQAAVDRAPTDGRWHFILGDLRDRAGDRAGAIAAHRRALEVDAARTPERLVMILMQPDRAGRRDFGAVIQLVESSPALLDRSAYLRAAYGAALVATGNRQRGFDQLRLANDAYRQMIAGRPDLARVIGGWYDQLVAIFTGPTRMADLEAYVRTLIDVDSSWSDLQALGTRWAQSGPDGSSRGVALLEQAEALSRDLPPELRATVLFDLGVAYNFANRCEDAVGLFRQGVDLDPTNAGNLNNLAYLMVNCLSGPADITEGLRLIEQAIRLQPNVAEFHDTHGTILQKLGRRSEAEAAFRARLALARASGTHIKLADLLDSAGRTNEARTELRNAAEIDPQVRTIPRYRELDEKLNPQAGR